MPQHSFRTGPIAFALVAAVAALIGHQSIANRPNPEPQGGPTGSCTIATFDLEKTFNTLDQKKAEDAKLLGLAESMNAEAEASHKSLQRLEADLEVHSPGTPKYKELEGKYMEASFEYRALLEFDKAKIDIERARTLKRIYGDIRKAVAEIAESRGFAVVLVDDSINPIPAGNEEETNRQISARRLVYTSPQVDITEELIAKMNKDFAAGGGTVPTVPAKNAATTPAKTP